MVSWNGSPCAALRSSSSSYPGCGEWRRHLDRAPTRARCKFQHDSLSRWLADTRRPLCCCGSLAPPTGDGLGFPPGRRVGKLQVSSFQSPSALCGAHWNPTHDHVLGACPGKRSPAMVSPSGAPLTRSTAASPAGRALLESTPREGGRTSSSAGCGSLSFSALDVPQVLAHRSNLVDRSLGNLGGEGTGRPGTLLDGQRPITCRHYLRPSGHR